MARSGMQSLEAWLASATRGLCEESQTRIREEVEAHYLETLRSEIAKGGDAFEAVLTADRSLGNARAARRQFRRRHLTKHESTLVECFPEGTTRPSFFRLSNHSFSTQNHINILLLTYFLCLSNPTVGQAAFILVLVPLYVLTTNALWNPPKRMSLSEKFQRRARVAAMQIPLHLAALLYLGNLVVLGGPLDPNIMLQLFGEYGYRLVFGGLIAFRLWDIWFNLRIARKVRGCDGTPEPT